MRTGNEIDVEMRLLRQAKSAIEKETAEHKKAYAASLLNGMGDRMTRELKNPPKPSRWKRIKFRIKRIFLVIVNQLG